MATQSFGRFYSKSLSTSPVITKSITAGIIFGMSDYTAQLIEKDGTEKNEDDKGQDWVRILTSTAVGLFYFGPAAHAW
eukprot:CAMPEP_0184859332 /NCGR_PEP_ID=MMETSP0580-20130426/4335_1 /TAXON_ID=1118495 /ORGANISM="Dactyliosolen fragilissimus" /LENGTH=77 /DNA_ID=CAMNT_0027355899 /DNA_START=92 /DNA_END=322 /DNA_ORIENTATION=+